MTSSADLSAPATVNVRPWRADADYVAMAQVSNACAASGMLDAFAGPEDYRWMARYLPGFRPETQILLAEAGNAPVGFAHARLAGVNPVAGHVVALQVRAVPGHVGLDAELLERAEVLAQELVAGVADEAGPPGTWETVVEDSESRLRTLVEQRGYRPVKQGYRMRRELTAGMPEHALPRGFELRPVTRDNGLQVLRAFDEAMRDSHDYGGMPDVALERLLEQQQWMLGDWDVAWQGDEVVAGILGWVDEAENRAMGRRRGYVERIFTRRPWRRQGLASALICQDLRTLRSKALREAALAVDADNPSGAVRLYEALGFERYGGFATLRRTG